MYNFLLISLQTLNQLLTAAIAITAFSLLLYALAFNLRDRVARSFALILVCVVIVFVGDAIGSVTNSPEELTFWLRIEWVGIVFLPPAYLLFSDAVLTTTAPARCQAGSPFTAYHPHTNFHPVLHRCHGLGVDQFLECQPTHSHTHG
jgi:hypothetical protein